MIISILLIIVIFSSVVLVHEWGHFVAARRNGIEVEEFGFGFPPRIFGIKRGQTLYSINWLPLGGFVRMKGEDQPGQAKGSFNAASLGAKVKVLIAGVSMNVLLGYVILVGLALAGLPKLVDGQFNIGHPSYAQTPAIMAADVIKNSPASQASISPGTLILSGNGQAFVTESDLTSFTKAHAGQTVSLVIKKRSSQPQTVTTQLNQQAGQTGYLGVTPLAVSSQRYGLWAPVVAAGITVQLVWRTLAGLAALIGGLVVHHRASAEVAGPVGIVVILNSIVHLGWTYLWLFVLTITISLAVINILPITALDGGRLALVLAKSRYQGLSEAAENRIHKYGFIGLLIFMALITIIDVRRYL